MLLLSALLWTTTSAFVEDQYRCPHAEHLPAKLSATDGTRVNLTEAANSDGAACLDGSVPVMYWRAGSGDGVNKFHVYFEGGGWCGGIDDQLSPCQDTCVHRSGTGLGSSNSYGAALNYDNSYMSTDQQVNPLAYNWNTVYVPYCDGASFSGNNDTAQRYNATLTLHWKGFRILNGVFKELNANYDWSKATDVLISGCSAGGLTTWLHSQHIYDTYVKPLGIGSNHFLSMPDSGFFLEWEGYGKYITAMQWLYAWQNTSGALNQQCLASNTQNPWKCMFAQETGPYEGIRMFPLQSRFDAWQSSCEAGSKDNDTMNEYGTNLTTNFIDMYIDAGGPYASLHSGFLDSCYHHCGEWDAFDIDGLNASTAQYQVYYGQNKQKWWFQNETYPCNTCCSAK